MVLEQIDRLIIYLCDNEDQIVDFLAGDSGSSLRAFPQFERFLVDAQRTFREAMLSTLQAELSAHGFSPKLLSRYDKLELYFESVSGYLTYYLLWIREREVPLENGQIRQLYDSAVLGTLGYRILDLYFDHRAVTDAEALMAMALTNKQERTLYDLFGFEPVTLNIIADSKARYLSAELREKRAKGKRSPYTFESPMDCGYKSAPIFPYFALPLVAMGRESMIGDYEAAFYALSAVVQILDDLSDLEEDLPQGMFTLPMSGLEDSLADMSAADAASYIYQDPKRLAKLYETCKELLHKASGVAGQLGDPVFQLVIQLQLLETHKSFLGKEIL